MIVDLTIYPLSIVQRAAHAFTGRCAVFFERRGDDHLEVAIPPELEGEFANALLDQSLRAVIAEETRGIRELLVAQAFAEADLLDRTESESDYELDVRGVGTTR